nr:hypothetical protein [Dendronalium sp. ChiSLP03b]
MDRFLYSVQSHLLDSDTHHFFVLAVGENLWLTPGCYFGKAKAIQSMNNAVDTLTAAD